MFLNITKHGVTQYFRFIVDMFFVLDFFISLMCVWLGKTTVLVICVHKQVKSIVFRRVHKILRWMGSSHFKQNIYLHYLIVFHYLWHQDRQTDRWTGSNKLILHVIHSPYFVWDINYNYFNYRDWTGFSFNFSLICFCYSC